jgi:hypothetical protein
MVSSGLSQVLRSLIPVKRGDDVHAVASAERINAIQTAIHLLTRGDNIVGGHNIRKTSGDGFVSLSADVRFSGPGGGGDLTDTPFLVVPVDNPDGPGGLIGVIRNSHLYNSESRDIYEVPNDTWGLLDEDRTPPFAFDPGSPGEKIFLEIQLDPEDQAIVSVEIVHGVVGFGLWDNFPDPIEINVDDPENPYQEFYHQIIAEITDPFVDPRPGFQVKNSFNVPVQVTQCLFTDLMMTTGKTSNDAEEPELPLLVALPWNSPATDTGGSGYPISPAENQMTPFQIGTFETPNDYNFELFNASEPFAPKVLILDGVVYGPNNDSGMDPDGMPSEDTYTIDVADEDEIWLGLLWTSDDPPIISQVWIDHGPSTPDDEEETTYVTIGNVSVDDSGDVPIVTCRNEVCGDVVIQLPPQPFSDNFVLMAKDGFLIWAEVCDASCGAD